jgi:hypothetical protein
MTGNSGRQEAKGNSRTQEIAKKHEANTKEAMGVSNRQQSEAIRTRPIGFSDNDSGLLFLLLVFFGGNLCFDFNRGDAFLGHTQFFSCTF